MYSSSYYWVLQSSLALSIPKLCSCMVQQVQRPSPACPLPTLTVVSTSEYWSLAQSGISWTQSSPMPMDAAAMSNTVHCPIPALALCSENCSPTGTGHLSLLTRLVPSHRSCMCQWPSWPSLAKPIPCLALSHQMLQPGLGWPGLAFPQSQLSLVGAAA